MDITAFVNLTSRAWALPILAKLFEGVPGRQAPMLVATGARRTAFGQSMAHLIDLGLIERNPGHGHPLRPEFRLTPQGRDAAKIAHGILGVPGAGAQDVLRRAWTVPILAVLGRPQQFSQIKRRLTTISDRALSQSLQGMEEVAWVQRRVDADLRPPRPLYLAVNAGAAIQTATRDLVLAG